MIAIPCMPIKLSSEFEMELLAHIESFGGEVKNIQALADGLHLQNQMKKCVVFFLIYLNVKKE